MIFNVNVLTTFVIKSMGPAKKIFLNPRLGMALISTQIGVNFEIKIVDSFFFRKSY